jgi:hypothetical protein
MFISQLKITTRGSREILQTLFCRIVPYDERFWCNTRHFSDHINTFAACLHSTCVHYPEGRNETSSLDTERIKTCSSDSRGTLTFRPSVLF